MAPTRTVKNKHAANKSGIKGSKNSRAGGPPDNGVVKSKRPKGSKGPVPVQTKKGRPNISALFKKKKKVYAEKDLDLPKLNMITPVGVEKPKGKKKGKVFVDDRESMTTILAMVQAEKEGQIESKMIKARQMEEIREARRIEAEKKEEARQERFDETKDSLRKKRKRQERGAEEKINIKEFATAGTKAAKPKKRKSVSFAEG